MSFFWLSMIVTGLMLSVGGIFGSAAERRHFLALAAGERGVEHMLLTELRGFPGGVRPGEAMFVCGEVVIANDYLKAFFATIRGFVGGEVRSFYPLAERARREAVLRMCQQAGALGHDAVCNIRLDFSSIGALSFAVVASGTAYTRPSPNHGAS